MDTGGAKGGVPLCTTQTNSNSADDALTDACTYPSSKKPQDAHLNKPTFPVVPVDRSHSTFPG